jgi:predicted nucleic acid-binding Zn ribbon protein
VKRQEPFRRRGRPRRPCPEPLAVRDLLAAWLRRQQVEGELRQYTIWTRWAELVGERLAARTQPLSLRDGVLSVLVANSAWLNELNFMRVDLVRRLNEFLGSSTITAVRLFSGPIKALPRYHERQIVACAADVELPPEYLAEVEREATTVDDPELREAIRGARIAQLKRRLRARGEPG